MSPEDAELEGRIVHAAMILRSHPDRAERKRAAALLTELNRQRSPGRVRAMEAAKGLLREGEA